MSVTLFFTSCEKEEVVGKDPDLKVRLLLKDALTDFSQDLTEEENETRFMNFREKYQSLTSNELMRYYDLRIEGMRKKFKGQNIQEAMILAAEDMKLNMIILNNASLDRFSIPYNQLDTEQRELILDELYPEESVDRVESEGSGARNCQTYSYGNCMKMQYTYSGPGFSALWVASSEGEACNDTEFQVLGHYKAFHASNPDMSNHIVNSNSGWWEHPANGGGYYLKARFDNTGHSETSGWLAGRRMTCSHWGWRGCTRYNYREWIRASLRAVNIGCSVTCNCGPH